MSTLIDYLLVALVLLASIGYVLTALGPHSWRRRVRSALGLHSPAAKSAGSCAACEGCGTAGAAPEAAAEIKIPVGEIGRR